MTYAALHLGNKLLKEIDKVCSSFIWKNRTHHLKKTVFINSYKNINVCFSLPFSPHNYFIWNNKDIFYKHKSVFLEHWFHNNTVLVDPLFNRDDLLFTCEEILSENNIPKTPGDYAKVFGVLPSRVCMLLKSQPRVTVQQLPLVISNIHSCR